MPSSNHNKCVLDHWCLFLLLISELPYMPEGGKFDKTTFKSSSEFCIIFLKKLVSKVQNEWFETFLWKGRHIFCIGTYFDLSKLKIQRHRRCAFSKNYKIYGYICSKMHKVLPCLYLFYSIFFAFFL